MNPDTLKRAVELADGWSIRSTEFGEVFGIGDSVSGLWGSIHTPPQYCLDALAAQLVRQVDAAQTHFVNIYPDRTIIERMSIDYCPACTHKGPDRTENTIMACVQFLSNKSDGC